MDTNTCQQVQHWVSQIDQSGEPQLPPAALVDHVANCANCRSMLLLLTAHLLPELPNVDLDSHEVCQDDLAAYIDAVRDHGDATAAQRYPHVWWHLCTCASCIETYNLTVALLEAEDQGLISTLPRPTPRPTPQLRSIGVFRVARGFINQVLNPLGQLGPAMGDDEEEPTILSERRTDQQRMVLSVLWQPDAVWNVQVEVIPPIRGIATVQLGDAAFRLPLDMTSTARVPIYPPELLTDPAGPDLLVNIKEEQVA